MRKLASIQTVLDIQPIPDADNIVRATVLGWHVVVKKDEFNIGDKVVYVEIDSILPPKPEFEFMATRKYRVRTIKLRKQVSQGIIFPLSILPVGNYNVDDDVTDILGIKKYDPEATDENKTFVVNIDTGWRKYIPKWLKNFIFRYFPSIGKAIFSKKIKRLSWPEGVPHTDETRVQILQSLLTEYKGQRFYTTEKVDGSSITICCTNGIVSVCSRNLRFAMNTDNNYVNTVKKNSIDTKLGAYCIKHNRNLALQGELLGPTIQSNKYKLEDYKIMFFSVFDIDADKYLPINDVTKIINDLQLEFVPILDDNVILNDNIDELVEMARGKSVVNPKIHREGIVFRLVSPNDIHVSFKAINPDFLLKYDA